MFSVLLFRSFGPKCLVRIHLPIRPKLFNQNPTLRFLLFPEMELVRPKTNSGWRAKCDDRSWSGKDPSTEYLALRHVLGQHNDAESLQNKKPIG